MAFGAIRDDQNPRTAQRGTDDPLARILGMVPGPPAPPLPPFPDGPNTQNGNPETPRETHAGQEPGTLFPTPDVGHAPAPNVSRVAPARPNEPTPVASSPQPFNPMPSPMLPTGAAPNASRMMFGRAGGLLGGGLGVPGVVGGGDGQDDDVSALMHLMRYMGNDGSNGGY